MSAFWSVTVKLMMRHASERRALECISALLPLDWMQLSYTKGRRYDAGEDSVLLQLGFEGDTAYTCYGAIIAKLTEGLKERVFTVSLTCALDNRTAVPKGPRI